MPESFPHRRADGSGPRTIWLTDNKVLHRINGPAVEYDSGSKFWLQNGQLHRDDGPAMVSDIRGIRYFIHGTEVSEGEHRLWQFMKSKDHVAAA